MEYQYRLYLWFILYIHPLLLLQPSIILESLSECHDSMDKLLQLSSGVTFHRNHIQKNSNAYFLEQDNTVRIVTTTHLSTKTYSVTLHHYSQQSYNVQMFILFTCSSLVPCICHWALHQVSASRRWNIPWILLKKCFFGQVMHIPSHSTFSAPL